jgi:hypothetical protein
MSVGDFKKDLEEPEKRDSKEDNSGSGKNNGAEKGAGNTPDAANDVPGNKPDMGKNDNPLGLPMDDIDNAATAAYNAYQEAKKAKEKAEEKYNDAMTVKNMAEDIYNTVKEIITILKDPSIDDIDKIVALANEKFPPEKQSDVYNAANRLLTDPTA